MVYFIFDTETTGFPIRKGFDLYFHPSLINYYNSSRLIQIAYIIADENKQELYRKVFYIKPNNFKVENSKIHGMTTEMLEEKGEEISSVLEKIFVDLQKCNVIVAHNLLFDINILLSECYRINNMLLISEIEKKEKYCTMTNGKNAFSLDSFPKLIDLYLRCTGKVWIQKHDAMDDTEKCFKCFVTLYK